MNFNLKYLAIFIAITFIGINHAQENVETSEGEPTTIQSLLELVKEGRTSEQSVNSQREKEFLADKNKQAAILAAEKRELARQEKIADQLEAEYKKNEEILKVKEAAYKKELGSLTELFGHLQSTAGESSALFFRILDCRSVWTRKRTIPKSTYWQNVRCYRASNYY